MIKPLLAFDYKPELLKYPCIMQPKLNGIRAIWYAGRFVSRRGELWSRLVTKHISQHLERLPSPFVLDGEFYKHGWPLQKIMSAMSVVRIEPNELTTSVSFNYFDIVDTKLPFYFRQLLMEKIGSVDNVNMIPCHVITSKEHGDNLHAMFIEQGYEGSIYRIPPCMYFSGRAKDNRSLQLLRRKTRMCAYFTIIDILPGKPDGKYRYVGGSLLCKTETDKTFKVNILTDEQRVRIWDDKANYIGRKVHVEFECYSDANIPLKPSLVDDSL